MIKAVSHSVFCRVGSNQPIALLDVTPDGGALDAGKGFLSGGCWLINVLVSVNYFGIETNKVALAPVLRCLAKAQLVRPNLPNNCLNMR